MAQSFGSVLRERRHAAGLTQRDLAERAGLDFSYISKLENDRLPPPAADTIVALAAILGTPADELLALTGKMPTEVQLALSSSPAAQEFLRTAALRGLTDAEWRELSRLLAQLGTSTGPRSAATSRGEDRAVGGHGWRQ